MELSPLNDCEPSEHFSVFVMSLGESHESVSPTVNSSHLEVTNPHVTEFSIPPQPGEDIGSHEIELEQALSFNNFGSTPETRWCGFSIEQRVDA